MTIEEEDAQEELFGDKTQLPPTSNLVDKNRRSTFQRDTVKIKDDVAQVCINWIDDNEDDARSL